MPKVKTEEMEKISVNLSKKDLDWMRDERMTRSKFFRDCISDCKSGKIIYKH